MMMTALAASVAVGWLAGGSLKKLIEMPLTKLEVLVCAFGIQLVLHLAPGWGLPATDQWGFAAHILSYVLVVWVMWENRRLPGMYVFATGVLLNLLVIAVNGGMPVCPDALAATGQQDTIEALRSGTQVIHQLMQPDTALAFLGDHLTTPGWFWCPTVYSPGDAVMVMGLLWLVPAAMRGLYNAQGDSEQIDWSQSR